MNLSDPTIVGLTSLGMGLGLGSLMGMAVVVPEISRNLFKRLHHVCTDGCELHAIYEDLSWYTPEWDGVWRVVVRCPNAPFWRKSEHFHENSSAGRAIRLSKQRHLQGLRGAA